MFVLEGKVKHLHQRGNWKRLNVSSALTSEEEEEILWTAKIPGDSNPGVLSHTMWWKATEGSECLEAVYYSGDRPHKWKVAERLYDEGNEREHRRYRTSHISRTPRQITTSNSFLRFSVWSFPTSAEQIQQASSRLAVAINNFHNCQVTFSVIKGQRGSPKSSDHHKLSVRGNYYGSISNLSTLNWFFMLLI